MNPPDNVDAPLVAFRTPADAPRWKRWLVYSPLARIVIFSAVTAAIFFVFTLVVRSTGWSPKTAPAIEKQTLAFVRYLLGSILAYLLLTRVIERRWPAEFSLSRFAPQFSAGVLLGAGLFTLVVGLMWVAGAFTVTGTTLDAAWLGPLLVGGLGAGVFEEIVFRGVIYRITEEGLGTWPALAISALIFGGVHLVNEGATLWSALAIAIEAGILLGLLYNVTRSLWPCIGLHAAWNFTQGAVWGVPVSGHVEKEPSFVQSVRNGPDWLTGGTWGAEASVLAVIVCGAASAVLLVLALRRNTIVKRAAAARPIMEAAPERAPEGA